MAKRSRLLLAVLALVAVSSAALAFSARGRVVPQAIEAMHQTARDFGYQGDYAAALLEYEGSGWFFNRVKATLRSTTGEEQLLVEVTRALPMMSWTVKTFERLPAPEPSGD